MSADTTILGLSSSSEYPSRLKALSDAPAQLFIRGDPKGLSAPTVGIVGSRAASEEGLRFASRLAASLSAEGVTIVTGGAMGIDEAALVGAQKAIVVLGNPVDRPGPKSNIPQFQKVLERGGLWVSELGPGMPPQRFSFAKRNRLVAGLSDMVVVVQATENSGTKHTVAAARKIGRPVGAVPWRPSDPGAGCIALIRRGAIPISGPNDVLRAIGVEPIDEKISTLDPERRKAAQAIAPLVVRRLEESPATVDQLVEDTALATEEIMEKMTELELLGVLEGLGGGRYTLTPTCSLR